MDVVELYGNDALAGSGTVSAAGIGAPLPYCLRRSSTSSSAAPTFDFADHRALPGPKRQN